MSSRWISHSHKYHGPILTNLAQQFAGNFRQQKISVLEKKRKDVALCGISTINRTKKGFA
jgi:hypothetical protein